MTKKKRIALIVVLVLAAFCLWYTRPLPFQELIPGAELLPCQRIRVYADYSPNEIGRASCRERV